MASKTTSTQSLKISGRRFAAVKRRAKELRLTPTEYVKQLIEDDLRLEHEARTKSLRELAKPFHEALKNYSEDDLDALVDRARRQPKPRKGPAWR
jgi:hypothetical protein